MIIKICGSSQNFYAANVNSGTMSADGYYSCYDIGGIIGCTDECSGITACNNTGEITVKNCSSIDYIGGLAGRLGFDSLVEAKTINTCFNNGKISIKGATSCNDVGGVIGLCSEATAISECANVADIEISSTSATYTGGIIGYSFIQNIENCYSVGNVSGGRYVAGIFGYGSGTISKCFAIGNMTANTDCAAGILGYSSSSTTTINNSYYNGNLSCVTENKFDICDSNNSTIDVNSKKLSADEVKQQTSYKGFDFDKTWEMTAERPKLKSEK